MLNGRELIKKAALEMNAAKLLNFEIKIDDTIDTVEGTELTKIVNYFLDSVETTPENKENLIPAIVISTYNNIIDKAVTFDLPNAEEDDVFDLENIVFRRTKFHE